MKRTHRVQFSRDGVEVASVWVHVAQESGWVMVSLLHDYPDLLPEKGWSVAISGVAHEVVAVDRGPVGPVLTCR